MEQDLIKSAWNDWETVSVLGRGSYGTVYKAVRRDAYLTTFSAVKVIRIPLTDPACTTPGASVGKRCYVCGEVIEAQRQFGAKGHAAVTDKAVAPTCTTPGKSEGKHCSVCGYILVNQTPLSATGHRTLEKIEAVAASCTAPGLKEGLRCADCGAIVKEQEQISAKGHTYPSGAINIEIPDVLARGSFYATKDQVQVTGTVINILVNNAIPETGDCSLVLVGREAMTCMECGQADMIRIEPAKCTVASIDGGAVVRLEYVNVPAGEFDLVTP